LTARGILTTSAYVLEHNKRRLLILLGIAALVLFFYGIRSVFEGLAALIGQMPGLLVTLGRFSPATYAASALRQTLVGPVTSALLIDLAVIIGCTIVTFWLAARKMDWRQR